LLSDVAEPGVPRELNVTQRLPTMLILYAVKPIDDGGMPVIGYRVQYDNKTLYDFDTSKGWQQQQIRALKDRLVLCS